MSINSPAATTQICLRSVVPITLLILLQVHLRDPSALVYFSRPDVAKRVSDSGDASPGNHDLQADTKPSLLHGITTVHAASSYTRGVQYNSLIIGLSTASNSPHESRRVETILVRGSET